MLSAPLSSTDQKVQETQAIYLSEALKDDEEIKVEVVIAVGEASGTMLGSEGPAGASWRWNEGAGGADAVSMMSPCSISMKSEELDFGNDGVAHKVNRSLGTFYIQLYFS